MRALILALLLLAVPAVGQEAEKPYQPPEVKFELPQEIVMPPPATRPQELGSEPLTADEAVRLALRYQGTVAVARTQIEAAEGRTQQAGSATMPRLNLTAGYQDTLLSSASTGLSGLSATTGGAVNTTGNNSTFSLSGYSANVSLNQLLFDFGHARATVRQSLALEEAARAGFTKAQADLVFQVKEAFYLAIQQQRLVAVNESNVKNRQAQLSQAQSRFAAGLGLPADVVRAQTAVSTAIFNLSQAQTNAGLARLNLNNLMGIDPRTPLTLKDDPEQGPPSDKPEELFTQALQRRPELAQARSQLIAARYGLDAANTTSTPQLTAALVYGLRGDPFFNTLGIQLGLNFSIYDGGLQAGKVREAEANRESAQATLDVQAQTVLTEVGRSYLNLKTAEERVRSAEQAEASAAESLRLSTGRYQVGLGIFLDVLDAQNSLLTAQTDRVNAYLQADVARAALNRAIGTTPPEVMPVVRTDDQPSPVSPLPAPEGSGPALPVQQ